MLPHLLGQNPEPIKTLKMTVTTTGVDEVVTIVCGNTGTYDANISWGDGEADSTITTYNDADLAHTYAVADDYTVTITGDFPWIYFNNSTAGDSVTALLATPAGHVTPLTTLQRAFYDCNNLASCSADFDTTGIEDWSYVFTEDELLLSVGLIDTSSATNMEWAFRDMDWTSVPLFDFSNVTNAYLAFSRNNLLTSFPAIDMPSCITFTQCWFGNSGYTTFPLIDVSSGTGFIGAWQGNSGLTSFPALDFSSATSCIQLLDGSSSLATFPANVFDTTSCTNFTNAFRGCALTATSVNNILISIESTGTSNGTLGMDGGTSAAPTGAGATAKADLITRGWTVTTN